MAQPQAQPAQREPILTRLSAMYQYHNAPEVAPAHGLEYDDNHYPHSDKYPVLREMSIVSTAKNGKYNYEGAPSKPPRIIFGMKIRTFLIVAGIMLVVILGAAIGGGVGGAHIQNGESNPGVAPMATSSSRPTATATTSIFSAPVPTYTPLSDCPASNNTRYISALSTDTKQVPSGLDFTRYCGKASPLNSVSGAANITSAFVYSFADCIEVCASYNFLNKNSNSTNGTDCTVAVYQPTASRPINCWVGDAGNAIQVNALAAADAVDVAVLTPTKQ